MMDRRRRTQVLFQGLLLCMAVVFCSGFSVWAAPQPQDLSALSTMEQALFSLPYAKDSVEQRVSRLEETILGEAQTSQALDDRIANLRRVFAATQPAATAPPSALATTSPPKASTGPVKPTSGKTAVKPANPGAQPSQPQASESDYPTVTVMENKLFSRQFSGEDISQRLERLEKKVFGGPQQGALVDRVDGLRLAVLGDTGTGTSPILAQQQQDPYAMPDPNATNSWESAPPAAYSNYPNNDPPAYQSAPPQTAYNPSNAAYPGYPSAGANSALPPTADLVAAIGQVEQQVLRKTFPADPVDARLSRLEQKIFHAAAPPAMSEEDRLQRIIAVASAGGSSAPHSGVATTMRGVLPVLLMILPLFL